MKAKCHKCKECIRIEVFGWSKFVYCNKVSAFGEEKFMKRPEYCKYYIRKDKKK